MSYRVNEIFYTLQGESAGAQAFSNFDTLLARYGYVFQSGGKYDQWFSMMPWYTPNASSDNQKYVYPKLSQLEWDNYHTIKKVAKDMDAMKVSAHTKGKKCYTNLTPPSSGWTLTGFSFMNLKAGQKLAVYSAPSSSSWRGANGKASVSTNGAVWAAGWENGWLLVFYETNAGSVRVGYVNGSQISGRVSVNDQLYFERSTCRLSTAATLTDDPLRTMTTITNLRAGDTVTYLTTMTNQSGWSFDYIETTVGGQLVRGFIPTGCLDVPYDTLENWDAYSK